MVSFGNVNVLQGTLGIYMKIRIFPRVVSFGFVWKYTYFTWGTLRICMKIHVFAMRCPLDLYGNIDISQGGTLVICMKLRVFPMEVSFVYV